MTYEELLKTFGVKLGGSVELTPDDAGAVTLDIDGMQLTILGLEEVGQVVLTGVVAEPPPEDRIERLYRAILEANHNFTGTFGATFSIDPETGVIALCRTISLALADGDSFFSDVEHFVNVLETWKKLVEDFRGEEPGGETGKGSGGEPDGEGKASDEALPLGGFGGFMQV